MSKIPYGPEVDARFAALETLVGVAPVANVVALTENSGAIGGTNNSDIPTLTATAATLAGTLTGSADGTIADVAAVSTAGGNTYADSAINTAITSVNLQLKELQTILNAVVADNVVLRAAVRECAAKINEEIAAIKLTGAQASS